MKTHDLIQGSPEWKAYRAVMRNASDAPAMMNVSPYTSRSELLRQLHTGVPADIDVGTQMRFDNGHRAEALARPLAEEFVGELFPVVGSEGNLSASFDGITIDDETIFEHKALNNELRAVFANAAEEEIEDGTLGRALPIYHRVQMEQQLLISGAQRALFMCSKWDADDNLIEEHHCYYFPDLKLRDEIVAGWAQFEKDLAAFELPGATAAAPIGRAPETLPALRVEVKGQVIASNLAEFRSTALASIRSINRDLKTDQDFADAEKAVKWCDEVESRIKAAKEHVLSQTGSIDEALKALEDIANESRTARLDLSKVVARRKTELKDEIVVQARDALADHVAALNAELAPLRLLPVVVPFADSIKGLRSFDKMQEALSATLATAKIAADAAARGIRTNVALFKERAAGFEFLFVDLGQVVHKAAEDFALLVQARIDAHQLAEGKRREAERQRIQAEEATKARAAEEERTRKAQADEDALVGSIWSNARRIEADGSAYIQKAARAFETAASDWQDDPRPRVREAVAAARAELATKLAAAQQRETAETATTTPVAPPAAAAPVAVPAPPPPAPAVVALPVSRPRADEPATLRLGDICNRLGFTVNGAFLADTLEIKPAQMVAGTRNGLYTESQFQTICRLLIGHVSQTAVIHSVEAAA